ncbi:MAG: arsenate reductase ArsC [Alphaproteobacteria bacterium]|nr:arsenate reductase ArsC [Alphaproteobacteria bacterium]
MNPSPTTVLFLSTGDAARGILAEALLRHKGGERFTAYSAGYCMLQEIAPQALALLNKDGVDTSGLYPKGWKDFFESPRSILVDVIVTLSEEARAHCPQWPGDPVRVHWPVDDPLAATDADERESKFLKCYDIMQNRVDALIKQRAPHSPAELMLQLRSIASVV